MKWLVGAALAAAGVVVGLWAYARTHEALYGAEERRESMHGVVATYEGEQLVVDTDKSEFVHSVMLTERSLADWQNMGLKRIDGWDTLIHNGVTVVQLHSDKQPLTFYSLAKRATQWLKASMGGCTCRLTPAAMKAMTDALGVEPPAEPDERDEFCPVHGDWEDDPRWRQEYEGKWAPEDLMRIESKEPACAPEVGLHIHPIGGNGSCLCGEQ